MNNNNNNTDSKNNNNETDNLKIISRTNVNSEESTISVVSSNGGINEIPKIVGKLGRLETHNYLQFKQNGSICDNLHKFSSSITKDPTPNNNEAMDQ